MNFTRALVWHGSTDFRFTDVPFPDVLDGETLVELTTATICGSDRHTVVGRRSAPCPSVLGHEGVGIVHTTRNPRLQVGQRVIFSVTAPCLSCDRCSSGMTAKCRHVKKTGHESFASGWPLSGTYATHILLKKNQPVVVVPNSLSDVAASVAACAGATVMAALEQAGELRGKRVLVMGIGMLGLIAVEAAVKAGASEVIADDLNPTRVHWAEKLGAKPGAAPVPKPGVAPPPGNCAPDLACPEFDVAFEFSGSETGVRTCISSLGIGGRAILAGSVATSPTYALDPEWLVRGWRTISGVHNYEPRHLQQATDFLASSSIAWNEVVSQPVSLADVPVVIGATERSKPTEFLRTAVTLR